MSVISKLFSQLSQPLPCILGFHKLEKDRIFSQEDSFRVPIGIDVKNVEVVHVFRLATGYCGRNGCDMEDGGPVAQTGRVSLGTNSLDEFFANVPWKAITTKQRDKLECEPEVEGHVRAHKYVVSLEAMMAHAAKFEAQRKAGMVEKSSSSPPVASPEY